MGRGKEIIVDETITTSGVNKSGTVVRLDWIKTGKNIDKRLDTIARNLVEKLLPYFITADYRCPRLLLSEMDESDAVVLNDFVNNQISSVIQELPISRGSFELKSSDATESFQVRLFKVFYPKNLKLSQARNRLEAKHAEFPSLSAPRSGCDARLGLFGTITNHRVNPCRSSVGYRRSQRKAEVKQKCASCVPTCGVVDCQDHRLYGLSATVAL